MKRAILLLATSAVVLTLSGETSLAAVVSGTAGSDNLKGTDAPDSLFGAAGDDTLNGRGADDDLFGQANDDFLIDDAGDDALFGGPGDDLTAGNPGDDAVFGGGGDDLLLDDLGEDFYSGGPGDDAISAPGFGPGSPELYVESDIIFCGPGFDEVDAHPFDLVAADCEVVTRIPNSF